MSLNPDAVKVVAFDVFGTVVDMSGVPHVQMKSYIEKIRGVWAPLFLPESWERLPAHPDSAEGIGRLRKKHLVVTCSNGPLGLLARLSKHNWIWWDAIIPLEMARVFKPDPRAYQLVCNVLDVEPEAVLVVTANEKFGDLEQARALGMQAVLIRRHGEPGDGPTTITELAELLGC